MTSATTQTRADPRSISPLNPQVIKLMQSFTSKELVKEQFSWRYYYWYLTNEGIEYLREYLNLWNPNEQAVEIAQRKLGQLCKALGIEHLSDTDELLNRSVQAKIYTKPGSNGYEAQNAIGGYSAAPAQSELDDDVPF